MSTTTDQPPTLWDLDSRNLIGEFCSRGEALAYLRGVLDSLGAGALAAFALQIDVPDAEPTVIMDDDLLALVQRWRALLAPPDSDTSPSRRAGL